MHFISADRRTVLAAVLLALPGLAQASVLTVTTNADAVSPPSGSLRSVLLSAEPGDTVNFACGAPCTITLAAALPPITHDLTIDGGTFGNVFIDGANTFPGFFVDTGTVRIANLQIQNATARGGDAGGGGGGGGLGAGGGLFVNQAGAVLTVQTVRFVHCRALGGSGSLSNVGGGGGGLFFAGGGADGGAGGGVLSAGGNGSVSGGIGGIGGGGGGGPGGLAGAPFTTNAAGTSGGPTGLGSPGGDGGFGGGGGAGGTGGGNGGNGGFGGGGGGGGDSSSNGGNGGNGGPGGGGGSGGLGISTTGNGGTGGMLTGGVQGGNGSSGHGGGGGAAVAPAIFVNRGSLLTINSDSTGQQATSGAGGGLEGTGTPNATPVFNYAGTVNGSSTVGPIPAALGSTTPLLIPVPTLGTWAALLFAGALALAGYGRRRYRG
jgi:hypothetical protein